MTRDPTEGLEQVEALGVAAYRCQCSGCGQPFELRREALSSSCGTCCGTDVRPLDPEVAVTWRLQGHDAALELWESRRAR